MQKVVNLASFKSPRAVALALRSKVRQMVANYSDFEPEFWRYRKQVRGYTMTSLQRQYGLFKAAQYVCDRNIPGCFVECGVWRGGSSLLAALVFQERGDLRDLWLYDTFAGMTPPTEHDSKAGSSAEKTSEFFAESQRGDHNEWCYASLEDVKACLGKSNYPEDRIHYVVGDVTTTLPESAPDQIAILRLDTDFYESTKHELEHLYDRLVPGGLLIIDDYGGWEGARKAVDEYFGRHRNPPFLVRVDETGRVAQKCG